MDGVTLLDEARAAGLSVQADGDRLRIRGPRRAEPIARRLIANKALVPHALAGRLPPDWHLQWDERAAIMEVDGGLPRERAEALALLDILEQMRRHGEALGH
jgi:hypothetical protein